MRRDPPNLCADSEMRPNTADSPMRPPVAFARSRDCTSSRGLYHAGMSVRLSLSLLALLLLSGARAVADDSECVVQLVNGDRTHVLLHGIGPEALDCRFSFAPDTPIAMAYDKVEAIHFEGGDQAQSNKAGEVLHLRDYGRIRGVFQALDEEGLRFRSDDAGELLFPLALVARMERRDRDGSRKPVRAADGMHSVLLEGGDRVSGDLTQKGDRFEVTRGDFKAGFAVSSYRDILFPAAADPAAAPAGTSATLYCEAQLKDGSQVFGVEPSFSNAVFRCRIEGGGPSLSIPARALRSLAVSGSLIPTSRQIILWDAFADRDEEAKRTEEALEKGLEGWRIVRMQGELCGRDFRNHLMKSRALVIPELEQFSGGTLSEKIEFEGKELTRRELYRKEVLPLLKDYQRRGGRVILLCVGNESLQLVQLLDLIPMGIQERSRQIKVPFTEAGGVVSGKIGDGFQTTDATTFYTAEDPVVKLAADEDGASPALLLRRGNGSVVALGMDFYESNEQTSQLLVNSVLFR